MAAKSLLTVSNKNGVGLSTRPMDNALTLRCNTDNPFQLYKSDGTLINIDDLLYIYDNIDTGSNVHILPTYDEAKSTLYLKETFEPGSNVIITIPSSKKFYLNYSVEDISCIEYFNTPFDNRVLIADNNYSIQLYSFYADSTYEVEQL